MITPKFDVGDAVYVADWTVTERRETCPDCLGSTELKVVTPAGEEFAVECQTCRYGWERRGYRVVSELTPLAYETTVGSVRIDTNDDPPVTYMVEATGVGTGRCWREEDLFSDREAAEARAEEKCAEAMRQRAESAKRERQRARRDNCFRSRWERHARGLCAAVTELLNSDLTLQKLQTGSEFDRLVRKVRRYIGWIKPGEV